MHILKFRTTCVISCAFKRNVPMMLELVRVYKTLTTSGQPLLTVIVTCYAIMTVNARREAIRERTPNVNKTRKANANRTPGGGKFGLAVSTNRSPTKRTLVLDQKNFHTKIFTNTFTLMVRTRILPGFHTIGWVCGYCPPFEIILSLSRVRGSTSHV